MKKLNTVLLLLLAPLSVQAATYDYDCEPDDNGIEGLCIAEPLDSTAKGQTAQKAEATTAASNKNGKLVFGTGKALDDVKTPSGVAAKSQAASNATAALKAQEKIRQVEIFLQPTKGERGLGTLDSGPIKAGQ